MSVDITPEAVEQLARECNALAFDWAEQSMGIVAGGARDTLRALSARLAEVEAIAKSAQDDAEQWARRCAVAEARAEAAEAALATARADHMREAADRFPGGRQPWPPINIRKAILALIPQQEKPHDAR